MKRELYENWQVSHATFITRNWRIDPLTLDQVWCVILIENLISTSIIIIFVCCLSLRELCLSLWHSHHGPYKLYPSGIDDVIVKTGARAGNHQTPEALYQYLCSLGETPRNSQHAPSTKITHKTKFYKEGETGVFDSVGSIVWSTECLLIWMVLDLKHIS
jgi:hypothetical protein